MRKKWFQEVFWCFRWFLGHFISVSGHFSNTRQTWACSNSFRPFRIKYKSVEPTGKTHFNYWTVVNRSEFRRPFEHRNRTDFEVFGFILFWFDLSLRQDSIWIWGLISLLWSIIFWSTFYRRGSKYLPLETFVKLGPEKNSKISYPLSWCFKVPIWRLIFCARYFASLSLVIATTTLSQYVHNNAPKYIIWGHQRSHRSN